jgi:hypothetical protein
MLVVEIQASRQRIPKSPSIRAPFVFFARSRTADRSTERLLGLHEPGGMNKSDYDQLNAEEKQHFYQCQQCGEMADMRQLDDVLFHEDHKPRPDIHYEGSKRLS